MIMRDPVSTLISQYLQIRKDEFHPFHAHAKDASPRDFIVRSGFGAAFADVHTRHLYAVSPANYEMLDDDFRTVDLTTRRARLEAFADTFDIDTIRYAGSIDQVAQTYERVCMDYGLVARPVPRLNPASIPLPAEIEDLMEDLADYSPADRRLITRFNERTASPGASGSLLQYTRPKFSSSTAFPIDGEYFMRNWHPAEPHPSGGWARWSRGGDAEILVPVTDRLRAITLVFCVQNLDAAARMKIHWNGTALKYKIFRNYDSPYAEFFVHVDIRKTARTEPFSTLRISGVVARRPSDTEENGDPRLLGIYLRRMGLIF